ncbi:MAG: hypothetical protein HONBIEJF_01763 [Fimbriimonadaceae bacterium]|nr:hypothetical protein [Fimbriimonadaceae bacterium]
MAECKVVRGGDGFQGKQGLQYFTGLSAESVGSVGICMHLLEMPPGTRANAHLHEGHETAIFMLEGEAEMLYGHDLSEHMKVAAGDFIYIPAGVPHLPYNAGSAMARAVLARTDPNEQESVVLLPQLDKLLASSATE